jgi:hypothetical protein
VVLGVGFEVLGEAQDAFREERDLHIGATCVFRVEAKAVHFICYCCFCHFVLFSSFGRAGNCHAAFVFAREKLKNPVMSCLTSHGLLAVQGTLNLATIGLIPNPLSTSNACQIINPF